MNYRRLWPLVLLVQAPLWMGLNREKWQKITPEDDKKVIIRHSCKDAELEERIEKNSKVVRSHAKGLGIKVDDRNTCACGYELLHGTRNQRIPSEASSNEVMSEIHDFFVKKK